MWFVANCSSMLSLESMKGVAIIPALLLAIKKASFTPQNNPAKDACTHTMNPTHPYTEQAL